MRWQPGRASAVGIVLFTLTIVGGSGCSPGCAALTPLPAPVPKDQTVEGGVQIRVTPAGFGKLTSIVPGLINGALGGGFCLPRGNQDLGIADIVWCGNNDCAGGAQGCRMNLNLDSINMSVPDAQTFRVETQFDVSTTIPINADLPWPLPDVGCDPGVSLQNARVVAGLAFSIDPATGHLRINLAGIQALDITNINFSGCGFASDLLH